MSGARAGWAPWVAAVGAVLALVVLAAEPGVLTGAALLGNGTPDVWGHAWGYAWAADALSTGRFPLCDPPVGTPEPTCWLLVDLPVALVLAPVAGLLGPALAWNLGVLGRVALGAGALSWWARREGVPAWVAVGVGGLWALSPFVRGAIASGVPEALSVGALPLVAHAVGRGLSGSRRALALAALASVLLVLDGFYGAVPLGLLLVVIGVARVRDLRVLARWCVPAAAAAAALAGAWWLLRWTGHPGLHSEHLAQGVESAVHGRWVVAPFRGADLLNLLAPGFLLPEAAPHLLHRHTAYLGLALIPAAALAWRARHGRLLLALAAVAALLALGPDLRVAGDSLVPLPGGALTALGMDKLYRVAGLAVLALLAAGALAWSRLPRPVAAAWMALVLAEGLLLAPLELRLPAVDDPSGPLERWLAVRDGAVVDLPLDRPTQPTGPWPQRGFMLQAAHGRPVASGMARAAPVLREHRTIAELDRTIWRTWERERAWGRARGAGDFAPPGGVVVSPVRLDPRLARLDRHALLDQGFAWVTLDGEGLPPSLRDELTRALALWLGEPARCEGERCAWAL